MTSLDKMKNIFMEDQKEICALLVDSAFNGKLEKHILEDCKEKLMALTSGVVHTSIDELFSEEDALAIVKFREELQPKTELLSKLLHEKLTAIEPTINKLLEETYIKHAKE